MRKYFWVVSLVTGALVLTIRGISVVWLNSHLPSAPSDSFAKFRFTHLTVSCGAVPVSFPWSWLFSQLVLLFENYGWHFICLLSCHNTAGLCSHVWLCGCSAHTWLLSLFCPYYFRSQGHETCLNADLLCNSKAQTGSNAVGDPFWSNLFRDDTVSYRWVIRLLPM